VLDTLLLAIDDPLNIDANLDTGSGGLSSLIFNCLSLTGTGLDLSKAYRTASLGVPGAPGSIQITIAGKNPANWLYSDVINGGNNITGYLDPASGQITGYRVYASTSSSGPWNLLLDMNTTTGYSTPTINDLNTVLFGTSNADPIYWNKWALLNNHVYFMGVAYNGEGEGPGITIEAHKGTAWQTVKTVAIKNPYLGAVLNNGYALSPITDNNKMYIAFQEPIDPSKVSAGNFGLTGGNSVLNAKVLTRSDSALAVTSGAALPAGWGGIALTIVEIDAANTLIPAGTLTVTPSTIQDLAGNYVDTTGGAPAWNQVNY
jgi:hypothetical protein